MKTSDASHSQKLTHTQEKHSIMKNVNFEKRIIDFRRLQLSFFALETLLAPKIFWVEKSIAHRWKALAKGFPPCANHFFIGAIFHGEKLTKPSNFGDFWNSQSRHMPPVSFTKYSQLIWIRSFCTLFIRNTYAMMCQLKSAKKHNASSCQTSIFLDFLSTLRPFLELIFFSVQKMKCLTRIASAKAFQRCIELHHMFPRSKVSILGVATLMQLRFRNLDTCVLQASIVFNSKFAQVRLHWCWCVKSH